MTGRGREGTRSLKVVQTACEILELLTQVEETGVTELADRLDIPKTTAHSYLQSLDSCGLAMNDGGRYSASLKVLEYAGRVRDGMDVYKAARSDVDTLARDTEEAVNVGVCENGKQVIIHVSEGNNATWNQPSIGERDFLNQTAIGKAILAHLPEERVTEIIDTHGLPKKTEHTITGKDELFQELTKIRDQGYAIQDEEYQLGVSAIGIPIQVTDGPIGAVSVTGPTSRLTTDEIQKRYLERLTECVNVIELQYEHYL